MQRKRNIRVLIVDESPLLRREVRQAIARTGVIAIHDFGSGEEAWSVLPAVQPAILIIGHQLEDMHGFELSRRIRSNHTFSETPLILLSPIGHLEDLMAAVDNGIDAYVVLPFEPANLAEKVKSAVQRIRSVAPRPAPHATATSLPPDAQAPSRDEPTPPTESAPEKRKGYGRRTHVGKER